MGENPVATADAIVMMFDDQTNIWSICGAIHGISKIQLFKNHINNTYRVVGWKIADKSVILNCAISRAMIYKQERPTFYQWRYTNHLVYGLNFINKDEAEVFSSAVIEAIGYLDTIYHQSQLISQQQKQHIEVQSHIKSEKPVSTVKATVMIFDCQTNVWSVCGATRGISKVQLLKHQIYNTYRVVGWKLSDNEIVLNCAITHELKYDQTKPKFHQWRYTNQQFYGLHFTNIEDADEFATALMKAIENLNQIYYQSQELQISNVPDNQTKQKYKIISNVELIKERLLSVDFSGGKDLEVTKDTIPNLSVKQMLEIFDHYNIDYSSFMERSELISLMTQLCDNYQRYMNEQRTTSSAPGNQLECKICMNSVINCAFIDCGHSMCCYNCGMEMATCPICRKQVKNCQKLFFS